MPGREEIGGADTSASSASPSRTSAGRSRLPRPSLSPARSLSSTSLSPVPSTCNTLSPPPPHAQNRSRHSPQRTGDVAAPQKAGDSARTFLPRLSPTRLQRPSNFENSGSQKSPKSPRRAETDHVASAARILAAAASAFPLHRFQEFRGVPVFSFGSVRTDHEVPWVVAFDQDGQPVTTKDVPEYPVYENTANRNIKIFCGTDEPRKRGKAKRQLGDGEAVCDDGPAAVRWFQNKADNRLDSRGIMTKDTFTSYSPFPPALSPSNASSDGLWVSCKVGRVDSEFIRYRPEFLRRVTGLIPHGVVPNLPYHSNGQAVLDSLRQCSGFYTHFFSPDQPRLGGAEAKTVRNLVKDHLVAEVRAKCKERRLPANSTTSTVLADATPIFDVFTEFCDEPLEELCCDQQGLQQAVAPLWLTDTVIEGAYSALVEVLDREKSAVATDRVMIGEFTQAAGDTLRSDRDIYEAAYQKMRRTDPDVAGTLTRQTQEDKGRVRAKFPKRPCQPGLGTESSFVELKLQAAKVSPIFGSCVQELASATASLCTIAKPLKMAERLGQKRWLRGTVSTVCDVARALITVADFPAMLRVHNAVMSWADMEVVDFKDRLNEPTLGGWRDLLYLVRSRSGKGTYAHICELQVVFRPMLLARKGLDGHQAYAKARHLLEVLEVIGETVDIEQVLSGSGSPEEMVEFCNVELDTLRAEIVRLKTEHANVLALKDAEIARLRAALAQSKD